MEEPSGLQSMGSLKSKTGLSDFTFTFHFHALEKEMATHSSVLAWRIPGWWAAICGVAQSQTQLKRLSSSSINFITESGKVFSRQKNELLKSVCMEYGGGLEKCWLELSECWEKCGVYSTRWNNTLRKCEVPYFNVQMFIQWFIYLYWIRVQVYSSHGV